MPAQKSILDFVKRAAVKRTLSHNVESVSKKLKTDSQDDVSNDGSKYVIDENTEKKNSESESVKVTKEENSPAVRTPPNNEKKVWPNAVIAKIKLTSKRFPALHSNIGHSWFKALEPEFQKPYFSQLSQFLQQERAKSRIFPPEDQVWAWTHLCSVSDVKVVILGQDPYHNPGQAHGLCFSVPNGVTPPPSLLNMYQELEMDIPGFKRPGHGNLTGWAEQGVLLLNACLTVRCNSPNSHKDQGWEKLTDAVIKHLSMHKKGIVFLLWGSYAQKKAAVVDKKKHTLLTSTHPSPLSAHRGFIGCKHFSQCNKILQDAGKSPIDWGLLPPCK